MGNFFFLYRLLRPIIYYYRLPDQKSLSRISSYEDIIKTIIFYTPLYNRRRSKRANILFFFFLTKKK